MIVSYSFTNVVILCFLDKSDFTFDNIIDIISQFISSVVMVNDVKLQIVGVYDATTYET